MSTKGRNVPYTNSSESRCGNLDDMMRATLHPGRFGARLSARRRLTATALRPLATWLALASSICGAPAQARGVTPYLPLHQSPEIERKIERLLILADRPILTRPIAAATVLDALAKAC